MAVLSIILTAIIAGRVNILLILATGPHCLVKPIIHLWSTLLWPASLDILFYDTLEGTNAHSTLAMPSQCVVSSKRVAAQTWIWLGAGVNFRVPLQVMSTDEALLAVIAPELAVS